MEDDYQTLSPSQYKLLTILPIPTAVLSVVGSGAIIYMVARSRRQREWTPYKRLLFGMSACDILLSINAAVGNIMRPEISSPRVWAFGNQATCTASGFLGQLSLSAILYNGGLSFYFLLSARFGWKNDRIATWVEPLTHVTCIGYPMVTAAIGAGLGVFSEPVMGLGCQINDYPRGCGEGPGKTGEPCLSIVIAWVFVGIPRILNGFAIVLNNLVICVFVWQQTRSSEKPEIPKNDGAKAAAIATSDDNSSQCDVESSISPQFQQKSVKSTIEDSFVDHSTIGLRESPRPRNKKVRSIRDSFETDRVSTNLEPSSRTAGPFRIRNPASNRPKTLTSIEGDQLRRLQLVRSQAILFVGCYFISNFWIGLTSFLESISSTDADEYAMAAACYPLLIVYAIFVPLQGFFNMLVYMRPKYGKYRTHFPEESRLWALWLTLTGEDSPKLRNKNKEESVDPYSAQNLAKSANTTPLPPLNGEEKEGVQAEFSQEGSEVCSPIDASVLRRSSSHAVHTQTIWTNDEFSPHQYFTEDGQAIVEESTKDVEERPTMWQPIQKSHHFISSLKSSSLEVISEMSEMSFDYHEDDRWKSGSKLSNCSSIPLTIPKRPESLAEPMNRSEDLLEQVHDSLQGPSPKCSLDSPLSCPKRRLSPPPIRTDIL